MLQFGNGCTDTKILCAVATVYYHYARALWHSRIMQSHLFPCVAVIHTSMKKKRKEGRMGVRGEGREERFFCSVRGNVLSLSLYSSHR